MKENSISDIEQLLKEIFPEGSPEREKIKDYLGTYTSICEDLSEKAKASLRLATISERLQFDGDAPEIRTGPLPSGVSPAPLIDSETVSPVALGMMLKEASREIETEIKKYEKKRDEEVSEKGSIILSLEGLKGDITKLPEGNPYLQAEALSVILGREILPESLPTWDSPKYRRGNFSSVKVKPPSSISLALLSEQERKESAWYFISTSQGRKTALPTISDAVEKILDSKYEVRVIPSYLKGKGSPVASWAMNIGDGPSSLNPNFSFIDLASKYLSRELEKVLEKNNVSKCFIVSFDDIPNRDVGWSVFLALENENGENKNLLT